MLNFRIKLDLSNFYNDHRKQAYVSIKPEWKVVKSLQKHVRNLFNLPKIALVTEECFYLHPLEDIGIISKKDVLKVLECEHKSRLNGETNEPVIQKEQICNFATENPKEERRKFNRQAHIGHPPLKKQKSIHNDNAQNGEQVNAALNDNIISNVKISVKKLKKLFDNNCSDSSLSSRHDQLHKNISLTQGKTNGKLKRKRIRKKKTKKDIGRLPLELIEIAPLETPKITLNKTKTHEHIRFDDDGNAVVDRKTEQAVQQDLAFRNHLSDLNQSTPRIVTATIVNNFHKNLQCNGEGTISETGQNITVNGAKKDKEIYLVEEQHESNVLGAGVKRGSTETFKCADILNFAEPLESQPMEGDILLFKIHRLNENYEPALSNYICGKFEGIEESTNFLKIFLIDGQDQLQDPEGKFSIGLQNKSSEYLFLKYDDLIDKMIFKM